MDGGRGGLQGRNLTVATRDTYQLEHPSTKSLESSLQIQHQVPEHDNLWPSLEGIFR